MNQQIQSLRGLACVLLVLYHVVGADPSVGLRVADGPVRWLNDGLAYLRMPLFTVLSGVVYGLRPLVPAGDSQGFLTGKVQRLLVPMLVVGTFFALLQAVVPGANSAIQDWRMLHIEPVAHFWFLESLFWVFLLIWWLERNTFLGQPSHYAVVFSAAVILYLTVGGPRLLGIQGAIYLLPYFLAGLALPRFGAWPQLGHPWLRAVLLLLALAAVLRMGLPAFNPDRRTVWMLLAGLSLCGLCLGLRLDGAWLARIGASSYPIYLFHVFFTAGARIALEQMEIGVTPLQIGAGLVAGVAGPIVVDKLASRSKWPAQLLLGKSSRSIARETSLPPTRDYVHS